jgi:glycosyltransferase involved in cell wall biosynthesis
VSLRNAYFNIDGLVLSRLPAGVRAFLVSSILKIRTLLTGVASALRRTSAVGVALERSQIQALVGELAAPEWAPRSASTASRGYSVPFRQCFTQIRDLLGDDIRHLHVVPRLNVGGAQLVSLNILTALAELRRPSTIGLVITDEGPSEWLDRVPTGVHIVPFADIARHLAAEEKKLLLMLLFEVSGAIAIHINYSNIALEAIASYGNALPCDARIFLSAYAEYPKLPGRVGSRFATLFESYDRYVSSYIADNAAYLDVLNRGRGVPRERLRVTYMPCTAFCVRSPQVRRDARVLWASRFATWKRPDILLAVATQCPDVQFDVYGGPRPDVDYGALLKILRALRKLPNVQYHGAFKDLSDVLPQRFDAFLYTSELDGMPNILLEIGAACVPIVAPKVGGIPELINESTGWPVDAPYTQEQYVERLRDVLAAPEEACQRSVALVELLQTRHSWEAFKKSLVHVPNYLAVVDPAGRVTADSN